MFDLDWSKLALIAVVALVVIGPKDLPRVMRMIGQWVQRARAIARDFQGSLDQMVREAELDEVKRTVDQAANFDVEREIHQTIDPEGDLQKSLNDPVLSNPLIETPKPAEEKVAESAAIETEKVVEPTAAETKPTEDPHPPADAGPSLSSTGRGQG
jgi:sec-independent protein translocase protein TatB